MIPRIRVFAKAGVEAIYGGGYDKDQMFYEIRDIDFYDEDVTVWGCHHKDCGMCDDTYKIEDVEVMQYTGCRDKNGLEVYFNDVVEDEYGHRYEVVFEGDCLRCNGIRKIRGGHKPKNRWFGIDLEIIGNRFENPKLLEEEE